MQIKQFAAAAWARVSKAFQPAGPVMMQKQDPAGSIAIAAGDLVVVRVSGVLTRERRRDVRREFRRAFPRAKLLLVDDRTDFDVFSAGAAE